MELGGPLTSSACADPTTSLSFNMVVRVLHRRRRPRSTCSPSHPAPEPQQQQRAGQRRLELPAAAAADALLGPKLCGAGESVAPCERHLTAGSRFCSWRCCWFSSLRRPVPTCGGVGPMLAMER